MKKYIRIVLFFLLVATSELLLGCEEETIQPAQPRDGNIVGMDDWYKHNT